MGALPEIFFFSSRWICGSRGLEASGCSRAAFQPYLPNSVPGPPVFTGLHSAPVENGHGDRGGVAAGSETLDTAALPNLVTAFHLCHGASPSPFSEDSVPES